MKRIAKEDDDVLPAKRRRDEEGSARQHSTSSDAREGYQDDSVGYRRQVSNNGAAVGAPRAHATVMPDNRSVAALLGLQTSTHPSTGSMSSTATTRASNMSVSADGVARSIGATYSDPSAARASQPAAPSAGAQKALPLGTTNNRLVASMPGGETARPSTTPSMASTATTTASNTSPFTGGVARPNESPQQYQQAANLSSLNPFLNVQQPPLALGGSGLAAALLQQQQDLQSQRMLAQLAAAQTIADAQSIGGTLADPRLLSALATSPPMPLNIPILGGLPPVFPPPMLDPISAAAIAQAGVLLQAQQQQQQQGLLLQQSLLALLAPPPSVAALAATTADSAIIPSASRRYLTTQSGDIDTSVPPAPPLGPVLGPVRRCPLSMPRDIDILSEHQVLLRQQIEFFEARPDDIRHFCPGRRREISVGQVGIRCKHCAAALAPADRSKGSVYFPSSLRALYQAAQNMGTTHFLEHCPKISPAIKEQLRIYTESPANSGYGGKKYWANGALSRGIYETDRGLRFRDYVT